MVSSISRIISTDLDVLRASTRWRTSTVLREDNNSSSNNNNNTAPQQAVDYTGIPYVVMVASKYRCSIPSGDRLDKFLPFRVAADYYEGVLNPRAIDSACLLCTTDPSGSFWCTYTPRAP